MRKFQFLLIYFLFFSMTVLSQTNYKGIKQNTICINGEICLGDSISKAIQFFGDPDGISTIDKASDEEWTERPQKEYKFGRELHKEDNGQIGVTYDLILFELLDKTKEHILLGFYTESDKYFLSAGEKKYQVGMKLDEEVISQLENLSHYKSFDKKLGNGRFLIFIIDNKGEIMNDVTDFKIGINNYFITTLSAIINLE